MAEQFNIMQSLFGFTPQAVQQQEMQAADTQAMQLASAGGAVAPSLFYGLRAANRFGAAPVFGPSQQAQQAGELQTLIQQVQQQGVDLATPEGMTQLAQTLQANPKFTGIGVALSQQAQKMAMESQKAGAEIFQRTAAGMKSLQEKEPSVLDKARQTVIDLGGLTDLNPQQRQALSNAREVLKLASPGTTVTVGDKAANEAAGKIVGQNVAQIENKYSAIDSIKEARDVLNQGIYAGIIGPEKQFIAKITGGLIGDKDKVARTEEFLSYIGNTVIPRLTEFGGNDSVEELRYLTRVMGGDQRLEPESLKRILDSAERKIQRGIKRIQTQTEALQVGKQLPLGPNIETPSAPKATKKRTKSGIEYEVIGD